jgi:hypothetical protein
MIRWTDICDLDDIPPLGARRVRRADGVEIAVFRAADDRVFALLDRCPHKGGPLSSGQRLLYLVRRCRGYRVDGLAGIGRDHGRHRGRVLPLAVDIHFHRFIRSSCAALLRVTRNR